MAPSRGEDTPMEAELPGLPCHGPDGCLGPAGQATSSGAQASLHPSDMGHAGYGDTLLLARATPLLVTVRICLLHGTPQAGRGMGTQVMSSWHLPLTLSLPFQDLSSPSQYDTGVALTGLSCFVTPDLARDLANDIMTLVSL